VGTSETWTPSRRLQAAALAERDRIERELARLDERYAELTTLLDDVHSARLELRDKLNVLNGLLHEHAAQAPAPDPADGPVLPTTENGHGGPATTTSTLVPLRGARIREAAVQVLASSPRAREAIHYRDWFALFMQAGFIPAGKEPAATFLTQLGRSPVVRRTTEAGVYELDFDFPDRARARLNELRAALQKAHEVTADADLPSLAAARETRTKLSQEVESVERALEEALRSLEAPEPEVDPVAVAV
jgi:hypothetical protein